MMYAGVDYSMSCPAITIGSSKDYSKCKSFFYTDKKKFVGKHGDNIYGTIHLPYEHEMERYDNISEWAMTLLRHFKVTDVCMEGYSMGSKGQVFNIAENGGLLKYKMWSNQFVCYTPSPNSVKKDFTGKGNAKKDEMHEEFIKRTGVNIATLLNQKTDGNPTSDIVDSYAMLCYGIDNHFS